MKVLIGLVLAYTIGGVCRLSSIPVPAPPAIIGALLVVAMTLGFIGMDRLITKYARSKRARKTNHRPMTETSS